MKKNIEIYLLPLLYFAPIIFILFFFLENLPTYLPYVIGCLYAIFIVKSLIKLETSAKPVGPENTIFLKLIITWIILYLLAIKVIPIIIFFVVMFLNIRTEGIVETVFATTILGTFFFLKILSKWDKFQNMDKILVSLVFAILISLASMFLDIEGSFSYTAPDGGSFVGGSTEITSETIRMFLILIVSWQVAMTGYLYKKILRD